MEKVTHIGGVRASWDFTRRMAKMCLTEIPPEKHQQWFERVAQRMSCTFEEAQAYISGDKEPPESVSFRFFKVAAEVSQEILWGDMFQS